MELKTFTVILALALIVAILKMLVDTLRIAILKEDIEGYKKRINVLYNLYKMPKYQNTQSASKNQNQVLNLKQIPHTMVEIETEHFKNKDGLIQSAEIAIINNQIKYLAYKGDL